MLPSRLRAPSVALVCVIASALAGGCTSNDGDRATASPPREPASAVDAASTAATTTPRGNLDGQLTIGSLMPLQGDGAATGIPMATGVGMAVRDINVAGGVNGAPVVLASADEGDSVDTAAVALDELLAGNLVDSVVGPSTSRTTLAVLDRLVRTEVPACSPAATADALSDNPAGATFIRTIGSDVLEGTAVGSVIALTGRQRVAVLAPDDDYGRGMAEAIQAQLETEGAAVSAVVPYRAEDTNVQPVVAAALESQPEAIAVVGLPEAGGRLLAALKDAGVVPGEGDGQVLVVVTDGLRIPNLYQRVTPGSRDATAGVWGVAPSTVPVEATSFVETFGAFAPGVAVDYAGFAYDCTVLLALASQSAGSDDPLLIAAHLGNVSRGGVRCDSYAMCATLLDGGRNIDYAGVTGAVDLTNGGDADRGFYDVFEFNDDGSTTVRTRSLVRLP